jgi:hypothetical protein
MLAAIVVYFVIAFAIVPELDISIFEADAPELTIIPVVLGLIGVILLILGFTLPRLFIRYFVRKTAGLLVIQIVRLSFFESVGIFGLLLGIIGAEIWIALSFMIVSAGALLMTYPTDSNCEKFAGKYGGQMD